MTEVPQTDGANPSHDPFDVTWRERVVVLGGLGLALAMLAAFGFVYYPDAAVELLGLVPVSQVAVGKFLPLWGISGKSSLGPYQLGAVIWVLDTITVVVTVYALEGFYRIRPLKTALERIQTNASLVLRAYPRMRRAATVGVVAFVLFPVAGTGAFVGAFIGILLGMHRARLIAAVSLGGFIGGFTMAYAAVHFGEALQAVQDMQKDPATKYYFVGGVLLVIGLIVYMANRAFRRALESARAELEGRAP